MNAASTNAYHVVSGYGSLCCHKAVASTGRVVAGDQCEGSKYGGTLARKQRGWVHMQ
jgi:hypothetical protein